LKYNLATHSIKNLQNFDLELCQVNRNKQDRLQVQVVTDWTISVGLEGVKECNKFFEWADQLSN